MKSIYTVMALAAILMASGAQAAVKGGEKFGDWAVACEQAKPPGQEKAQTICHVFQNLKVKGSGKIVLEVQVGYLKDKAVMFVVVPLGVFLAPGVQLQVDDGTSFRVPYEVCTKDGCRVGVPLNADRIGQLQKGKELKISVINIERKIVNLPVSLKGFSKAFAALK